MNIVIEGLDNSGKSTLASHLSRIFAREVYSSEGPEKHPGELMGRVMRYSLLDGVIFDRHPCVSDPIYATARGKPTSLTRDAITDFYASDNLYIYCDAHKGLGGHVLKAHDTPEHMQAVESHFQSLLQKYRQWAIERAHIVYRLGDDPARIINLVAGKVNPPFEPMQDVEDFMRKFQQLYSGPPRALPQTLRDFRRDFLNEELKEYHDATDYIDQSMLKKDKSHIGLGLALQLDALVDLMYVLLGTAQLQGFNFREAWRRVHKANMKKVKVANANESTRHSVHDVRKPEGWKAPDHSDLVEHHIHR